MGRTKQPPYPFGEAWKVSYYSAARPPPSPPASRTGSRLPKPSAPKLPPELLAPTSALLLSLPDHLLILISSHLDPRSLSSLSHVHRRFLSLATPQQLPPPTPPLSELPPLHLAALKSDTPTVLTLLSTTTTTTSTDVNSRAALFNGKTPLYFAALTGHLPTVRALLDNGATINTSSEIACGKSALHLAASAGNAPLVRLLLKRGARASTEDFKGRTPILWAARSAPQGRELVDVFQLLAAAGASVNSCDLTYGASVLHWAAVKRRRATVEWLLERGASVVAPTFFELRTPVGWALECGDGEMVGLLRRWAYRKERKLEGGPGIIGGWIKRLRAQREGGASGDIAF